MSAVADRIDRRSLVIVVSDFLSPIADLRSGFARLSAYLSLTGARAGAARFRQR